MATFFMFGKYSPEATTSISAARTNEALNMVKRCGGEVKEIYSLLGEHDLVLIVELPTVTDAIKTSIDMARLTGISFSTTPAISVAEFDELMGR